MIGVAVDNKSIDVRATCPVAPAIACNDGSVESGPRPIAIVTALVASWSESAADKTLPVCSVAAPPDRTTTIRAASITERAPCSVVNAIVDMKFSAAAVSRAPLGMTIPSTALSMDVRD
jgi:hypothetical protein